MVPDAMGNKWNGSLPALGTIPCSLGCSGQMSLAVAWCSCKSYLPRDPFAPEATLIFPRTRFKALDLE